MTTKAARLLLFILFVGSLAACSYRVEKDEDTRGVIRPSAELVAKVSFADVYRTVLQPKCISCHGTSGGVSLETYASTKNFLGKIHDTVLIQRRMPLAPVAPLTREELELVAAWVEAGGPEFPLNGDPVEPPPADPVLQPNFPSIKELIVDRKCLQCHTPGKEAGRIPLTKLDEFINSPLEIVIPGNAEESGFVLVLLENARKRMPPPETGMAPVSPQEIEVIKEWINSMDDQGQSPSPEPNPTPPVPPRNEPAPLAPTFASIKANVIDRKCLQCHIPGGKAERIPLKALKDFTESPLEIVIPGNAEESGLVLVTAADARKPMPPVGSGIPAVTPEEINVIKEWIQNGAIN
jgi:uncharacterized membrane protein